MTGISVTDLNISTKLLLLLNKYRNEQTHFKKKIVHKVNTHTLTHRKYIHRYKYRNNSSFDSVMRTKT